MTFGDVCNWNITEMKLQWKRFYDAKSATWRHDMYIIIATPVGWSVSFLFHFSFVSIVRAPTRRNNITPLFPHVGLYGPNIVMFLKLLWAWKISLVINMYRPVRIRFAFRWRTVFPAPVCDSLWPAGRMLGRGRYSRARHPLIWFTMWPPARPARHRRPNSLSLSLTDSPRRARESYARFLWIVNA